MNQKTTLRSQEVVTMVAAAFGAAEAALSTARAILATLATAAVAATFAVMVVATAANATDQTIDYEYDALGRLTRAVYDGAVSVNYEYDLSGNITNMVVAPATTDVSPPGTADLPAVVAAALAAPNPFLESTRIGYQLPAATKVGLRIYNAAGRRVRTLVDGPRDAGYHTALWDGTDDRGRRATSGVYFYRFEASGTRVVREILLLK